MVGADDAVCVDFWTLVAGDFDCVFGAEVEVLILFIKPWFIHYIWYL